MKTVREHYENFLGPVYSWILGDFDKARKSSERFFEEIGLVPSGNGAAVDLGCGPGCQTLPLAERGFEVVAIDFCAELLDELRRRNTSCRVKPVCDDIAHFRQHIDDSVELVVCMGDTLVHLPDTASVYRLIEDVCASLSPGGKFIYAIRDYKSPAPGGAARFIPIRASDDRIFTCFLDYEVDSVHVHDILHKKVNGEWLMEISDYRKLRLGIDELNEQLAGGGLGITTETTVDGMIAVVAEKA